MSLKTFKFLLTRISLYSWLLTHTLARAVDCDVKKSKARAWCGEIYSALPCGPSGLPWSVKLVHEAESLAKVRHLNSNYVMAEDETINLFRWFLLLILQVLHLLQRSETLENSTRNHPASSKETSKPSMTSSSAPKAPKKNSALLEPEFERIRNKCPVLVSTGCTKEFCQSGRMIHTDEPRVGENRSLQVVEQEAVDFVRVLREEGFYNSKDAFQKRLNQVRLEIAASSNPGVVREDHSYGKVGGIWTQTYEELEFGIRRAWRNARKCIMRSHCEELILCDLRRVTSSAEMLIELVKGLSHAFNEGNVKPTVFVFPPRNVNARGPMIWNHQVLQFAGYESEGGTILGDPASVELTNAIINLGWEPPEPRGRWDLLPLVAMAEGDCPAMIEVPADLRKLVRIRHPKYVTEFERLDLQWVAFPALTRLGFDIGGVQYTAAPFIGWFMDSEIGVRDLADAFRYNVLPDIIDALRLTRDKLRGDTEVFEDLPEYEKLSMLSRAQAELNYAVHWSFIQTKVKMTDTLTASMKWCRYDDAFKEQNGYRLPADPYWLAPPQGSIVPLWHRGGAPNYQPKPIICKHAQDPIKAWGREKQKRHPGAQMPTPLVVVKEPTAVAAEKKSETETIIHQHEAFPGQNHLQLFYQTQKEVREPENQIGLVPMTQQTRSLFRRSSLQLVQDILQEGLLPANGNRSILIFFCSAGTVAEKLANKLHRWVSSLVKDTSGLRLCSRPQPLNRLNASDLTVNQIILLVVSSTGQGEIPSNGHGLSQICENILSRRLMDRTQGFRFAVFGNGDSRYSATYNGAAIKINDYLTEVGGNPLVAGVFQADTAMDPLPWCALRSWLNKLQPSIVGQPIPSLAASVIKSPSNYRYDKVFVKMTPIDIGQRYEDYQDRLLSTFGEASLLSASPRVHKESLLVRFDLDDNRFAEMSCIQVLSSNAPSKVNQALRSLCVKDSDRVNLGLDLRNPTYLSFLTDYVDLELPFLGLEFLEAVELASQGGGLTTASLSKLPVRKVLERIHGSIAQMSLGQRCGFIRDMCQDMPLLHTRTYSIASSQHYSSSRNRANASTGREIDIMVKMLPGGRFSDTFMKDCILPASLRYRIVDSMSGNILRQNHLRPFIVVATGAGFGPVRCLLQWRISIIRNALAAGHSLPRHGSGFTLFLGLNLSDRELVVDVLNEAMSVNLVDVLDIVLSNPMKRRVYDDLQGSPQHVRDKIFKQEAMVFVCTNRTAALATRSTFESILGGRVGEMLGERYVEEVY